jgi:endonuclease YncB( thermonuclease family)
MTERGAIVARKKIDPAISRGAYAYAEKALRNAHQGEFADLVDEGYRLLGADSPRVRREKAAEAAAAKRTAAAEKREKAAKARLEAAAALLREAGVQVTLPTEDAA